MQRIDHPDGRLEILSDGRRLGRWLAAAACLMLAVMAHALYTHHGGERALGAAGAAGVFLLAALFVFAHSRFIFDPRARRVRWQRHSLFSRAGGDVSFSDITAVMVQSLHDTREAATYRLALQTRSGVIPFTSAYTGDAGGEFVRIAAALNAMLGTPASADEDSRARALVHAGRLIDAVRLLRAERGLSLTQAKALAEGLAAPAATQPPKPARPSSGLPAEALRALEAGNLIDAVRGVARARGEGLKAARLAVEQHLHEQPELAKRHALQRSRRRKDALSRALLWLAALLLLVWLVRRG